MQDRSERKVLAHVLARVRRKIFFNTAVGWFLRAGLFVLPVAAVFIGLHERWGGGQYSGWIALGTFAGLVIFSAVLTLSGLGQRVDSALTLDLQADLKDRVSSAWEFLEREDLSEPEVVQVRDAIRRAEALNYGQVLRFRWPRLAAGFPIVAGLLIASFFVPPAAVLQAHTQRNAVRDAQLQQLAELRQELETRKDLPEEVQKALEKLAEIQKRFEQGEIGDREVMLELGRLDEALRSRMAEMGVENLEAEMASMVPHLSANAATLDAAKAMQAKDFDKAAAELNQLAEKVEAKQLSEEEKKKLSAQLGAAAAKLGKKDSADSFSSDLADASESLEKSDGEGFKSATRGMCQKLGLMSKCQGLKSACARIGMCKGGLGQCNAPPAGEIGYNLGQKSPSKGKGGLKAGTGASGDPLGEAERLADSYKKMVQISGQAGAGPVETETELTEGQASQAQLNAREVHAAYAAAAEEVIEKEDVPLSQRYHVKRYFQAIRPQE